MAKIHGVKKIRCCGCGGYGCNKCNPIGEPQTQTNRTEPIPVAALPDYERLLNMELVTDYQDYLTRYVKGEPGSTPYIGPNGNWFINGVDTGVKAEGMTPYIGPNGNWWIGDTDTGVSAEAAEISPETDEDIFE